jgi:hypothetical protein
LRARRKSPGVMVRVSLGSLPRIRLLTPALRRNLRSGCSRARRNATPTKSTDKTFAQASTGDQESTLATLVGAPPAAAAKMVPMRNGAWFIIRHHHGVRTFYHGRSNLGEK